MKEIYLKHKDFITAIALHKLIPQQDNVDLTEIVNAWKNHLTEIKSNVVVGDCAQCNGGWINAVKDVYVYAQQNNYDTVEQPADTQDAEPTITKSKNKKK